MGLVQPITRVGASLWVFTYLSLWLSDYRNKLEIHWSNSTEAISIWDSGTKYKYTYASVFEPTRLTPFDFKSISLTT